MNFQGNRPGARELAARIAEAASAPERDALYAWAFRLLEVRGSRSTSLVKARNAFSATMDRHLVWPAMRTIAGEVRRLGWDERGAMARVGVLGAAAAVVFSGSGAVSIAALGTAVGVPLWVVFGGKGGTFAKALQEELERRGAPRLGPTPFSVLDAEDVEP